MARIALAVLASLTLPATALAHVEPVHFKGALTGETRPTFASVYFDEDGPGETPVEQMTREQLKAELTRLESERPGLGGPIALTAVGGVLLVGGLIFIYAGFVDLYFIAGSASSAYAVAGYVLLALGVAGGITGAALLTVGIIKMIQRSRQRSAYGQRIDDLNVRLEALDRGSGPQPPPPPPMDAPPPPPPPPPPPGAHLFDVPASMVVATF